MLEHPALYWEDVAFNSCLADQKQALIALELLGHYLLQEGCMCMNEERSKQLLEMLMDQVVDMMQLDGALELFRRIGFTDNEIAEMGY